MLITTHLQIHHWEIANILNDDIYTARTEM